MRLAAQRRRRYINAALQTAGVAAVVVIFAMVAARYLIPEVGEVPSISAEQKAGSAVTWASLQESEANVAVLSAEIRDIESDIAAVRLGESENGDTTAVVNIELEVIDANSTFWKG